MSNQPSNISRKENTNFEEKNPQKINCKDGFCYLPNSKEKSNLDKNTINIFDPLQNTEKSIEFMQ